MQNIKFHFLQSIVIYSSCSIDEFLRILTCNLDGFGCFSGAYSSIVNITPFASLYSPMTYLKCEITPNSFPTILLKTSLLFG